MKFLNIFKIRKHNCVLPDELPSDSSITDAFKISASQDPNDEEYHPSKSLLHVNESLDFQNMKNGAGSPIASRPSSASLDGRESPFQRPQTPPSRSKSTIEKPSFKRGKSTNWFSLSYKQKCDEFHKLFKDVPPDERLLVDYSCALQKDLLVQGRLYISQNWICFYANILRWETTVVIPCNTIKSITKEKTAKVIPNAIQINTSTDKFFFSSLTSRDKTYLTLFKVWQNAQMSKPMTNQQIWKMIHREYGNDLGLAGTDYSSDYPDSVSQNDHSQQELSAVTSGDESVQILSLETSIPGNTEASITSHYEPQPVSSDCSGTTSSDADEVETECSHSHNGWNSLDVTLNFTVDRLFELLFTESEFFKTFIDSLGYSDLKLGIWSEEPDEEGKKHRTNSLTVALNASFGPKSTPSTQKQHIQPESKPGLFYCVDVENFNDPSLPYGDNFFVHNRYCLSRVNKHQSRLKVHSEICYRKSVFSLVKSIIDKNVRSGVSGYYKPLGNALLAESSKSTIPSEISRKKKRFTKHRTSSTDNSQPKVVNGLLPSAKQPFIASRRSTEMDTVTKNSYLASAIRVMSALLIFLVMFNMLLFFKLWTLEAQYSSLNSNPDYSSLYNHHEMAAILNKQKLLHDKEIQKWHSALESATVVIEQLQKSLDEIKRTNIHEKGYVDDPGIASDTRAKTDKVENKAEL